PHDDSAISGPGLRRHLLVIADDSMEGRATPGNGLERAARYVAGEFRRLGLAPAGDSGGYQQRWGLARWLPDTATSRIRVAGPGWKAAPRLGVDVRYVGGTVDGRSISGHAVLLDPALPRARAAEPALRGRIVLLPVDYARPLRPDLQDVVEGLAANAGAVIILGNRDSATFAQRLAAAAEPRLTPEFRRLEAGAPVLELHRRALGDRSPAGDIRVSIELEPRVLGRWTAPNLVGVVEGADPELRHELVAITAHVDALGIRPGSADSVLNGADDNASGLAALLEIARAFRAAPPRRSILFLVPSGEEPGLWGSEHWVRHPTVPLDRIAAVLNMDLIGRNWADSVIVSGQELSTLGRTLHEAAAAHPELRMAPIADRWPEERIFYRSDHYHFARAGVPVLFFTSGTHLDYHQPSDSPDRVDAEKAARIARLLYQVARRVADDPGRPRWLPGHLQRIREGP
ncbi:MAG TPA: M28 family peptidase, partial [Gemmatimonadales bacterium]|nr:M28 family peptidase [Gemmatimonadales bacterium]